jgi:hypothetical protein
MRAILLPFVLLFVDASFVNEHYRDLVADGIQTVAGHASEAAVIGLKLNFRPAGRANQYLQKIRADCHGKFSV